MTPPEIDLLQELVAEHEGPCVTILLPLVPGDLEGRQLALRWRSLLRKATSALAAQGVPPALADEVLAAPRAWDPVAAGRGRTSGGLAVFSAPEFSRAHVSHLELPELAVVGPRFHVRPLLAGAEGTARFHVLALSQNHVRLVEGTAHSGVEIDVPGCPRNLAEALKWDEHERTLQWHGTGPTQGGQRKSVFHGQGGSVDVHKDEILRFCRRVEAAVHHVLPDPADPLVLACAEFLAPIYRQANRHPHLVDEVLRGSPDRIRTEELAARAYEIVRERLERKEREDARRFLSLAGTGRTCASVEEVVPAAAEGRVDTLFLAADASRWGTYDRAHAKVLLGAEGTPGAMDLLDLAAAEALSHGAAVHVCARDHVPAAADAAAILRY